VSDPLDDLKAAWNELEAPELAEDVRDADEATRRTVTWLRAAFEGLEVPEVTLPSRRRRSPFVYIALAAAAGLVALALARNYRAGPTEDTPAPTIVAEAPLTANPVFHEDGSIELRKGGVRLLLLPDPVAQTTEESR